MTRRRAILEAFLARLQGITVANGYATNAGLQVFLNETPELGEDDPPTAIAVVVDDDAPGYQGEKVFITLPLEVNALAAANLTSPWLTAEDVLGDIKKAVEIDVQLAGLLQWRMERGSTQTAKREPGSTTVGVAVTYRLPYREVWGHPEF